MALAQHDVDPEGGAPHPRRPQGARGADRDARRRGRAPADGRPRQDDPGPARRRAPPGRETGSGLLLTAEPRRRTGASVGTSQRAPMEDHMGKFVIEPHFRLQEWVAEEKGYFKDEGLDYVFQELVQKTDGKIHDQGQKVGAYQSLEKGRTSDISCACHWTVNVAASTGKGKLYADVYSVSPSGIFVPPDSDIKHPADLAGVPISVGYQSGSHYATIQALEQYLKPEEIKLSFADGLLFRRMELLIDRQVPAASLFSGPYYFMEQLGFRKIIDSTFMMASLVTGDADPEDVRKYFRALRRAQRDIDLRPDLYTHYYREEFPARFRDQIDTRRWGPGERLVFEPYTKEVYEESFAWIAAHDIFSDGEMGAGIYENAILPV